LTLLDLDTSRYQAGWGRMKYVNDQLIKYRPGSELPAAQHIQAWNDNTYKVRDYPHYIDLLEERGVYFSSPLDLDFSMLLAYPNQYDVEPTPPEDSIVTAVLGKSHHDAKQYSDQELNLFNTYHRKFKLSSKPAAHIEAIAKLSDPELLATIPDSLAKLARKVISTLSELPE
jgi:putative ATP-dependent endonuclease of OLD family